MKMVLTYVHGCGTIELLTHGIETSKSNEVFVIIGISRVKSVNLLALTATRSYIISTKLGGYLSESFWVLNKRR